MQLRPYRLSRDQADAAHAEVWDESAVARFVSRVSRLMQRGVHPADADDLAERLHLRDVQGDDRHMCTECRHGRSARCPDGSPLPVGLLHRCQAFKAQE